MIDIKEKVKEIINDGIVDNEEVSDTVKKISLLPTPSTKHLHDCSKLYALIVNPPSHDFSKKCIEIGTVLRLDTNLIAFLTTTCNSSVFIFINNTYLLLV